MATIYSNASGQVVEARDVKGTYYYLADGMGTPTDGAWEREDDAIAALDGYWTAPTVETDDRGYRLVECAYCDQWVRPGDSVPPPDDDEAWEEAAHGHADGCEWVATRAHRRDLTD